MIFQQHQLNNHVGAQTLLCILREKFWILRRRITFKWVICRCITCKRFKCKHIETPPVPQPKKITNTTGAFELCVIDSTGTLYLKSDDKMLTVLYTWALYRAIRLKVVISLSTDSFLLPLRRFLVRRGRVSSIYSNNRTIMVGANNFLKNVE